MKSINDHIAELHREFGGSPGISCVSAAAAVRWYEVYREYLLSKGRIENVDLVAAQLVTALFSSPD